MKGREWYQERAVAEAYESKRFSRGGRLIDRREKQAVLSALGPVEDRRILDIATGTGRFSLLLADNGAAVVGVDISRAMLRQARTKERSVEHHGDLTFLQGDASQLPFPDDAFDAVVAMRFFHLADRPTAFLAELRRVASEVVVFDTFNRYCTRSIYNWALPMGSRLASHREVHGWIEEAGLELVDVEVDWILPYGFYRAVPLGITRAVRPIDDLLVDLPLLDRLASVSYWTTAVA
ncbi:MAG: class I SAM-dependent methyltransferase [Halobacteriota archaeon]